MHRNDEDRKFEQPPVERCAKAQALANCRPVLADVGKVQKGVERSGEIALLVDERTALRRARAFRDGIDSAGTVVAPAYSIPNAERFASL